MTTFWENIKIHRNTSWLEIKSTSLAKSCCGEKDLSSKGRRGACHYGAAHADTPVPLQQFWHIMWWSWWHGVEENNKIGKEEFRGEKKGDRQSIASTFVWRNWGNQNMISNNGERGGKPDLLWQGRRGVEGWYLLLARWILKHRGIFLIAGLGFIRSKFSHLKHFHLDLWHTHYAWLSYNTVLSSRMPQVYLSFTANSWPVMLAIFGILQPLCINRNCTNKNSDTAVQLNCAPASVCLYCETWSQERF